MDFNRFSWTFINLKGSGARVFGGLCRPVPPFAALCHPVASCRAGLDPPDFKILDSGGLDLEPWMLVPGCWQDWNGLEEVTEVTAFWGEPHKLALQELAGFVIVFGMWQGLDGRKITTCGVRMICPSIRETTFLLKSRPVSSYLQIG